MSRFREENIRPSSNGEHKISQLLFQIYACSPMQALCYCPPSWMAVLFMCMRLCVHACVCGGQRSAWDVSPQELSTLSLAGTSHWVGALGLDFGWLASESWDLPVFAPPHILNAGVISIHLAVFFFLMWVLEIEFRSLCRVISTLLTETSPYPKEVVFIFNSFLEVLELEKRRHQP